MERIELALVAAGLIFILAGASQGRYRYIKNRARARHYYWATLIIGIVCFAVGTGRIWPNGVLVALIIGAFVVGSAYFTTPYLKIGRQIYASNPENREPDPSTWG